MADKNIGSLPQLASLDDDASFVVEQQGAAGRVSGAQFKAYWQTIMKDDLDAAAQALADAHEIYNTISARRPRWWFTDADPAALGEMLAYSALRGAETPSADTVKDGDFIVFTQNNKIAYCGGASSAAEGSVLISTSIGTMEDLGTIRVKSIPVNANLNAAAYSTGVKGVSLFESPASGSGVFTNAPPGFTSGTSATLMVFGAFGGWGCVQMLSRPNNGIWYRFNDLGEWSNWREIQDEYKVLTSPNGTQFRITVDDTGALTATEVTT